MTSNELLQKSKENKNFNIRSTIIDKNTRISTAAIFYKSSFFGDYYQIETIVFKVNPRRNEMKIHSTFMCKQNLDYAIRFHEKLSYIYKNSLTNGKIQ